MSPSDDVDGNDCDRDAYQFDRRPTVRAPGGARRRIVRPGGTGCADWTGRLSVARSERSNRGPQPAAWPTDGRVVGMTLSTIPRYDRRRVDRLGGHAVVVGASVAGLLAARVLADGFDEVTVLDRDDLPNDPESRAGVPQDRHPHALLEAGRATVADLLPGVSEDLVSAGAVLTDFAGEVDFYTAGGVLADGPARMETISMSRPLFEHVVRQHVTAVENVHVRPNCYCVEYLLDGPGSAVVGAAIREDGTDAELAADLVVDATGRASRTPAWLDRHGFVPPAVDEVQIDVAYSTTYVERPHADRRTVLVPPSAPRQVGGMVAPIEGDRWVVNLHGVHGAVPPTDRAGLQAFATRLPVPTVAEILDAHDWVADEVDHYPFPSNRRHRYEDLDAVPDGLLVVGDAIASFNPVYAQGMSVAALEALVLHHELAAGSENLPSRYFRAVADVVDIAWNLAVGADFAFPETTGPSPPGSAAVGWYLDRLVKRAHTDGELTEAFLRVLTMERPPTTLFRPSVIRRVLAPRLGRATAASGRASDSTPGAEATPAGPSGEKGPSSGTHRLEGS